MLGTVDRNKGVTYKEREERRGRGQGTRAERDGEKKKGWSHWRRG